MSLVFDLAGPLPTNTTLLEASAGTGKTFTIAHLAVRYLAERDDLTVDRLLIVTFTEAATSELRDRIRARLREAISALRGQEIDNPALELWAEASIREGQGERYCQRLELALSNFDAASISTIHGFCSRVLSQAAFESNADYAAELVTDTKSLNRDLVYDHIAKQLETLSVEEYEAVGGSLGIERLSKLLDELVRNPKALVLPQEPPSIENAQRERVESRRALREAFSLHGRDLQAELERGRVDKAFKGACSTDPSLPGRAYSTLARAVTSDALLSTGERQMLSLLTRQSLLHGNKKAKWGKLAEHPVLIALEEYLGSEQAVAKALSLSIQLSLARLVREELPERKRKLSVMGFDDLLNLVERALDSQRSPLRARLQKRYGAALIDEFQDTDPVQWRIFRAIFHEGRLPLLLIGDPKQAIYSFRGADLDVYLEARSEAQARYRLGTNHRSDGPLVEAVNDVFTRFPASLGDETKLGYEPVEAAHGKSRLLLGGEAMAPLRILPSAFDNVGQIPRWIAHDVLGFLQSGAEIVEKGSVNRSVTPRDCAVLVKSNALAKQVREALGALGIPSVLRSDESVLASSESGQLGLFLRTLADPASKSRLWAFLATELAGASAHEIARMREGDLAASDAPTTERGDDGPSLEEWMARTRQWSELFAKDGFMRAVHRMVLDLEVEPRWAGEPYGERRLVDLWHAAELIHAAQLEQRLDPEALALWLERERAEENASAEERRLRLETDADAVEIVTIHRSKGLEYPAVWCADLFKEPGLPEPCRYGRDGKRVLDLDPDEEAEQRARTEQLHESLRLVYVALTRAKHLCVVPWMPPPSKNSSRRSPLDWLFFGDLPEERWKEAREGILSHLQSAFADSRERIAILSKGFPSAGVYEQRAGEEQALLASVYRREPLDTWWRWSSYSSIVRAKQAEHEARFGADEVDERDSEATANADSEPVRESDEAAGGLAHLHDFKDGAQLGTLLHKLLEQMDFQNPGDIALDAKAYFDRYGMSRKAANHPHLAEKIAQMLEEVRATPLDVGDCAFRLSDIARADRLSELDFTFAIENENEGAPFAVTSKKIADVLRRHARPMLPARYADKLAGIHHLPLRGLLRGSIDLVFRRNGRYYVVDYKSNHLGDTLGKYAPDALLACMERDDYLLQAQIYSLALHRFLRRRLRNYEPETHFGGVLYLYLRAMRRDTGSRYGVYFDKPSREALFELDRLFAKGDKA